MARCMLCAASVDDAAVTCPHCGGAVEADDPTRVADPTTAAAGDVAPWDQPPPGAAPGLPAGPPLAGDAPPWDGRWTPPGPPPAGAPGPFGAPPPGPPTSGPVPYGGPAPYGGPVPYGSPVPYGGPVPYGAPVPYGQPVPYGAAPGYGVPFVPPRPSEGMALASLLTSVIGLVTAAFCYFPILACPVGAILGHVALGRIARTGNEGRGLALAGIIIGWIGTAVLVGIIVLVIAVVAGGTT